jgi:hypothetical protein
MINLKISKLAKFFDQELEDAKKILIVSNNGVYELFGRFMIEPKKSYFLVTDFKTKEAVEFSSLKYAMAWCILLDSNKYVDSRRLHSLDLKLCSLYTDIAVHRKLLKAANDSDAKLLYKIKLQEDSFKRRTVIKEIDTYINNSKTLQGRKFNTKKEHKFKYL